MSNPDGVYIDGERVDYRGKLVLAINEPSRLQPPLVLKPGQTVECWRNGVKEATFIEHGGRSISPLALLRTSDMASLSTDSAK